MQTHCGRYRRLFRVGITLLSLGATNSSHTMQLWKRLLKLTLVSSPILPIPPREIRYQPNCLNTWGPAFPSCSSTIRPGWSFALPTPPPWSLIPVTSIPQKCSTVCATPNFTPVIPGKRCCGNRKQDGLLQRWMTPSLDRGGSTLHLKLHLPLRPHLPVNHCVMKNIRPKIFSKYIA